MSEYEPMPFKMRGGYDQLELLGARWWQEGMAKAQVQVQRARQSKNRDGTDDSRRRALKVLVGLAGLPLLAGFAFTRCGGSGSTTQTVSKKSLDLQRELGLAVGASNPSFSYEHPVLVASDGRPLQGTWLNTLAGDLSPRYGLLLPYYTPTLFQAFAGSREQAFASAFRMSRTPAMVRAFDQAVAMRDLLLGANQLQKLALVVDLPGPEAVAYAAGLQPTCCAVFTFDNWPHPQGVVPAHQTLSAAVYYRSQFLNNIEIAAQPPVFVLDRNRLTEYRNEPGRFDNRYLAKLPGAPFLRSQGIERVLYVVPAGVPEVELDDLNETFVAYGKAGVTVSMVGLGDFVAVDAKSGELKADAAKANDAQGQPAQSDSRRYYWHGSPGYHGWFWHHYAWPSRSAVAAGAKPQVSSFGSGYTPSRRSTMFDGVSRFGQTRHTSSTSRSSRGSYGRSTGGHYGG